MRQRIPLAALFVLAGGLAAIAAQGPTFDVVSIKENTRGIGPGTTAPPIQRPDGGFTLVNVPVGTLIARAYPGHAPAEMAGLPDWARTERYDVRATSSLSRASAEDRAAMMQAMLADRFQLKVHVDRREQPVFDLIVSRKDGKLGPGLIRTDADCSIVTPAQPQPGQRPDFTKPPPVCTMRMVGATIRGDKRTDLGDLVEGEVTIATFTQTLQILSRRPVVDKTGLIGTYRIAMNYDMLATMRPPAADDPKAGPSVFTAIQEQLGLKLQPSKAVREILVIDRLERPTPN